MTKVKICGVTDLEDASFAVAAGAWAIGLNFYRSSPRYCQPEQAAIIGSELKRQCEVAGVFVNEPLDDLVSLAEQCELTLLQLHGDEGPSYCAEVQRRTGGKVIKAVRIKDRADTAGAFVPFNSDYLLLDSYSQSLKGGTGETFEWHLISNLQLPAPLILSGGLTPENVGEAIAVTKPFAVDVASGVEISPGRKDPARIRAFLRAVQHASAKLEPRAEEEHLDSEAEES